MSVLDDAQVFDSKGMKILQSPRVLTLDWDISCSRRYTGYGTRQSVVGSREYVWDLLAPAIRPGMNVRLYWTPNGVRGFLTSGLMGLEQGLGFHRLVMVDAAYTEMTRRYGAYNVRVSPKPGRQGDYVSWFWMNCGSGKIHPEVMPYIKVHDALCAENRDGESPFKAKSVTESLLRAKDAEPWEPANKNALMDYAEDLMPF